MRCISRSRTTLATIDAAAIAALRSSPSTTAVCSGAAGPSRKPSTRQTSPGGVSAWRHGAQAAEVADVKAVAVDARRRERLDADPLGAADDGLEQLLALRAA